MPSHTCKRNEIEKKGTESAKQLHIRKSFIFTMSLVSCASFEATPEKVGMVSRIRMQYYTKYPFLPCSHGSFGSWFVVSCA